MFWERLVSSSRIAKNNVCFVFTKKQLEKEFSPSKTSSCFILVESSLNWDGKFLQDFYGFDIAQLLRRDFLLKCPITILSPLKKSFFEKLRSRNSKYGLIDTKGCSFLSYPFSPEILKHQLSVTEQLSDVALQEVVIKHCGLQKEWRLISHQLSGYLSNHQKQYRNITEIVAQWANSINRFAPNQKHNLESFRALLNLDPESVDLAALKCALEQLDDGLQGSQAATRRPHNQVPQCPPKGFSRVLIADDESQTFLADSLRNQYGYEVISQAYRLSQAKELLNKEKPDVVLSDYYFKESLRKTEIPDKSIGDRFIQYALTHPQYTGTDPKKPLVLVTSKATLQTETEIRAGAINCSGASRATDPRFIHGLIWAEARKRGVTEQEKIWGQEWSLEHTCRLRLEQHVKDLPKLMLRWHEFNGTVRETLTLCRLLYESASNDDPKIIQRVITGLEPFEVGNSFSFGTVVKIFAETELLHKSALQQPPSQAKQAIRNILHGRIEQFSSVTNAVRFLITSLTEVARDLISLGQYRKYGEQLDNTLREYSETEALVPILTSLNENLKEAVARLPQLPSPASLRSKRSTIETNNINVIVVEDNAYWRDFVIDAIEATKSRLGENFIISYQHFDNAADALASIPQTRQTFAIDGSHQNDVTTIAIVDICLPENKDHAERIRAALKGTSHQFASPHSTHGLNLILNLCSYSHNIPVIVFSTIDSIRDRKTIGGWGVPDEDFLAKGVDDENAIVRALIRKIEKRTKYVIKRFEDHDGNVRFCINGIQIPFPKELAETFSALYRLAQTTGRNEFSITEIFEARQKSSSRGSNKTIQDHMYRIRNLVLETLQVNRVYVNVKQLIRTNKSSKDDEEEYTYQLNAEVVPLEEEEDYESDLQQYEQETCRVLVVEDNSQTLGEIIEPLESLGYEVRYATNVDDAVKVAKVFLPHIITLDLQIPYHRAEAEAADTTADEFGGLEAWRQIRMALSERSVGIIVPTVNIDRNDLVAQAAQMEIPIRNFISKNEATWLNLFLKKVADEKRRVFLGQITDATRDVSEPIVEILHGSDLSEGVLRLMINGLPFTMNKSPMAKMIGLLLSSPKTLRSFETIKLATGSGEPVTKDDSKNWTKRIRAIIKVKWLKSSQSDSENLSKKILESSVLGLRLNVHVIDSRSVT